MASVEPPTEFTVRCFADLALFHECITGYTDKNVALFALGDVVGVYFLSPALGTGPFVAIDAFMACLKMDATDDDVFALANGAGVLFHCPFTV